jgi:hypothetical protein
MTALLAILTGMPADGADDRNINHAVANVSKNWRSVSKNLPQQATTERRNQNRSFIGGGKQTMDPIGPQSNLRS